MPQSSDHSAKKAPGFSCLKNLEFSIPGRSIKQILFFIVHFFFCIVCFAQTPQTDRFKIDSLKKVLPSLRDSARIDCLNAIFRSYYWLGNDSFKYYIRPAYEESIKINYVSGIAEAVTSKAIIGMVLGEVIMLMLKN